MRSAAVGSLALVVHAATVGCAAGGDADGNGVPGLGGRDSGGTAADSATSVASDGNVDTSSSDPTSDAGTTDDPADASTSTSGSTSTGEAVDVDSGPGDSTGPAELACDELILDETFTNSGLERSADWVIGGNGNASSQVADGTLEIHVDAGAFWTAETAVPIPTAGAISVELLQAPVAPPGIVWLGLVESGHEAYIDVLEDQLRASFRNPGDDEYSIAESVPYDAVAHRHLRVRFDAADATAQTQTSADGMTWLDFAALDISMMAPADTRATLGSAASTDAGAPLVTVDNLSLCAGG